MNIGAVAKASGVSAKMIRHYEARGLLPPAIRSAAGYRCYDAEALAALGFIREARALGFGLDDIATLLTLWRDPQRASAQVRALAQDQLASLRERAARLQTMLATLERLVAACPGDATAACPILADLALCRGATKTP